VGTDCATKTGAVNLKPIINQGTGIKNAVKLQGPVKIYETSNQRLTLQASVRRLRPSCRSGVLQVITYLTQPKHMNIQAQIKKLKQKTIDAERQSIKQGCYNVQNSTVRVQK
jgi:hypothetical protein